MLGWADLPIVLCMIFTHGFGRDGFWSMVLDLMVFVPWYCMLRMYNMYCNIERNIMKNQIGSPILGSRGKSLCICVLCYSLTFLFYVF